MKVPPLVYVNEYEPWYGVLADKLVALRTALEGDTR